MRTVESQSLFSVASKIPEKAYLYFPTKSQQKVYIGQKLVRYIYFGQIEYQAEEQKHYKQFEEYLKTNKLVIPNQKYYNKGRTILFLSGNKYKSKQTFEAIIANREWRLQHLPPSLNPKRQQILDNGYIYVCGRDKQFRPIIVLKQKNLQQKLLDQYLAASIFGFQYIINNMFLPGQIENWVFIHDLKDISYSDISIDTVKKVNNIMSSGYGGKLYRNFIVNAPFIVKTAWAMVKPFIDPVTIQKITLDGGVDNLEKLYKYCDRDQVEVKYGGTKPNIQKYWPPNLVDPIPNPQSLISQQQYGKRYLQQKLLNYFIHPKIDIILS